MGVISPSWQRESFVEARCKRHKNVEVCSTVQMAVCELWFFFSLSRRWRKDIWDAIHFYRWSMRLHLTLCTVPSVFSFCVEQCQYTYIKILIYICFPCKHTLQMTTVDIWGLSSKLFSTVAIRLFLLVIRHGLHWSDPWYKKTCLVCVQGEGLAVIDNLIWYR